MTDDVKVSGEMQNAFIDGELGQAEWAQIAGQSQADARLRDELCELRAIKEFVQHAYPAAQTAPRRTHRFGRWAAVAALCVASATAGWMGRSAWAPPAIDLERELTAGATLREVSGDRILVHFSSSQREPVAAALEDVEHVLREAMRNGRDLRIEIVANSSGLDLFRAGVAPYPERLAALRAAYPNVTLVACSQTIDRLRERGIAVQLLPGVETASSALDQVVRRLQGGWAYVRA